MDSAASRLVPLLHLTIRPDHAMLRGFTDATGVEWRVWEVFPSRAPKPSSAEALSRSLKETPFANGWLCFESENAKRRLAPIPAGWEFATTKLLEELCEQASEAPLRRHGGFTTGNGAPAGASGAA
jgi:hypothetical protein